MAGPIKDSSTGSGLMATFDHQSILFLFCARRACCLHRDSPRVPLMACAAGWWRGVPLSGEGGRVPVPDPSRVPIIIVSSAVTLHRGMAACQVGQRRPGRHRRWGGVGRSICADGSSALTCERERAYILWHAVSPSYQYSSSGQHRRCLHDGAAVRMADLTSAAAPVVTAACCIEAEIILPNGYSIAAPYLPIAVFACGAPSPIKGREKAARLPEKAELCGSPGPCGLSVTGTLSTL